MNHDNKEKRVANLVPIIVLSIVIAAILLIPLRITAYGFLPVDDALRHSAKAISGKGWHDILVLRDGITTDSHPGWHFILRAIHRWTNWGTDSLVTFSFVSLFILFCIVPALMLKRPEALLISLLIVLFVNFNLVGRLIIGRPYIITMSFVLLLGLLWERLKAARTPYSTIVLFSFVTACSTWIHCSWYMLALPLLCFAMVREWRVFHRLAISTIVGIGIGAVLTGHPYAFLKQTLLHAYHAFTNHPLERMLVVEFQPSTGDVLIIVAVLGVLFWRKIRGERTRDIVYNPIFFLATAGWMLGFVSKRFWFDWGMPAVTIWMAMEFEDAFRHKIDFLSLKRVAITLVVSVTLYLAFTSDVNGRWTNNLTNEYLSLKNTEQAPWLPEAGGIIYSDSMRVFYDTFFANPRAPWRYVLGFEPTMMPEEDLIILRKIQWNYGDDRSYAPWVNKMKPEDCLILRRVKGAPPYIPELEWNYAATNTWVGRLPTRTR